MCLASRLRVAGRQGYLMWEGVRLQLLLTIWIAKKKNAAHKWEGLCAGHPLYVVDTTPQGFHTANGLCLIHDSLPLLWACCSQTLVFFCAHAVLSHMHANTRFNQST